jgi:hypothetical protein
MMSIDSNPEIAEQLGVARHLAFEFVVPVLGEIFQQFGQLADELVAGCRHGTPCR